MISIIMNYNNHLLSLSDEDYLKYLEVFLMILIMSGNDNQNISFSPTWDLKYDLPQSFRKKSYELFKRPDDITGH